MTSYENVMRRDAVEFIRHVVEWRDQKYRLIYVTKKVSNKRSDDDEAVNITEKMRQERSEDDGGVDITEKVKQERRLRAGHS